MKQLHRFESNDIDDSLEGGFTNPFRYAPCKAVQIAAQLLIDSINSSEKLSSLFSEGKMLGVLVVEDCNKQIGYLCGFSGNVGGYNLIDGFVPPIFDLLDPNGYFKVKEKEISDINHEIDSISSSSEYSSLCLRLANSVAKADKTLADLKKQMTAAKLRREAIRSALDTHSSCLNGFDLNEESITLESLTRESQHEKAEFRRVKKRLESEIAALREEKSVIDKHISGLKQLRKSLSDSLQSWIFEQYVVHNANGDSTTIRSLFAAEGLVPPGGTGECAAPKLLEYAYRNGFRPLAMGEFWYGVSPETAVRTHGHFYPSCTSKCGPLLGYMLKGLIVNETDSIIESAFESTNKLTKEFAFESAFESTPKIIYRDDDIVVVDKPSGMPSVPGLDKRVSLAEWLELSLGKRVCIVHRLDMDTSGVIIYALNQETASALQRQFEDRSVRKEYYARLCPAETFRFQNIYHYPDSYHCSDEYQCSDGCHCSNDCHCSDSYHCSDGIASSGTISIPLSPDYDERPRQKVDKKNGKDAVTEYEILRNNPDGTTDILFRPITGRTHQLRVHAAHILGLGRPILGDLLYGSHTAMTSESAMNVATGASTATTTGSSTAKYANASPIRLHLHARSITIIHPITGGALTFTSEPEFTTDSQSAL